MDAVLLGRAKMTAAAHGFHGENCRKKKAPFIKAWLLYHSSFPFIVQMEKSPLIGAQKQSRHHELLHSFNYKENSEFLLLVFRWWKIWHLLSYLH